MMMGLDLLLLVGVLAYALGFRPQFNTGSSARNSQNPEEILRERYANGEITREEYDQIRRDLAG